MPDTKDITIKKKQRAQIFGEVQQIIKRADGLISQNPVPRSEADMAIGTLNDYRLQMKQISEDILALVEDEGGIDEEVKVAVGCDSKILRCVQTLKTAIANHADPPPSPGGTDGASTKQSGSVKLPKLVIEKFDGDPLRWQEFADSFETTIDHNTELSDVDKLKYLKSFLSGEALRLADGYRLTAANYKCVWDTLCERFGNPQIAIFGHLTAMLDLPTASHDLKQLQSVYDDCERHIRSLVALGLAESTFGQVFTPIMLSKLPVYVKMELHRKNGDEVWTLARLRQLLKDEIRARDMSQRLTDKKPETQSPAKRGAGEHVKVKASTNQSKQSASGHGTASVLPTTQKGKYQCPFCRGDHYGDGCKKFVDLPSRLGQIRNQCYNCLRSGHQAKNCQRKIPCAHCRKLGHHRSLCKTILSESQSTNVTVAAEDSLNPNAPAFFPQEATPLTNVLAHGDSVNLQTALVRVKSPGNSSIHQARLLFDTAGSRSYITTDMFRKLGLTSKDEEIVSVAGFEDAKRRVRRYKITEVDIILNDGSKQRVSVSVTPNITCPVERQPIDVQKYPFLQKLGLAEPITSKVESLHIDILIGGDHYYDLVTDNTIRCGDGLVLISTKVGYVTAGVTKCESRVRNVSTLLFTRATPDPNFDIERFWRLEHIGIAEDPCESDDDKAMESFLRTVRFENGRHHVGLPWRSETPELPENYQLALGRLKSLVNRIGSDADTMGQYTATLQSQMDLGIIERAPAVLTGPLSHYNPHHCVVTPSRTTTKLRVVYDASAKNKRTANSLNDCLLRGPVLLEDLVGILIRFRLNAVAVVADVEKAFLQIGLHLQDRDVTRFLWIRDIHRPVSDMNVETYRFCRIPFGMISSPFLLAATMRYHLAKYDTAIAKDITRNVYVDNVVSGCSSASEGLQFYNDAKKIFSDASLNLREWFSNDKSLIDAIPDKDRGQGTITKVLGLSWDLVGDSLTCDGKTPTVDVATKRTILQSLATMYDPLGFFSPVTMQAKLLLQQLWVSKLDWDQPVSVEIQENWRSIEEDLRKVKKHAVQRNVGVSDWGMEAVACELHAFADASKRGYAAVVYLRLDRHNAVRSHMIYSKARVCPVKPISVPRLELTAVVIGVRMLKFVERNLGRKLEGVYLWSDSTCVLQWVFRDKSTAVFVKNRVKEIRSHHGVHLRYVPTECNPADLPSKGCDYNALVASDLWWKGPEFLLDNPDRWPATILPVPMEDKESDSEYVKDEGRVCSVTTKDVSTCLITFSKFSSLRRARNVAAWIMRYVNNVRNPDNRVSSVRLSIGEIEAAMRTLIRQVQVDSFPFAFIAGTNRQKRMLETQFGIFADDHSILRCRGRIEHASVPYNVKFPVLLPRNHPFTDLVIMDCHKQCFHSGVTQTLLHLRQEFWISQGRSQVKRILRDCRLCRKISGGPFRSPPPPVLPRFRVMQAKPFTYVGLDYLGPLYIKTVNGERKAWICLFTCAVVRAVHLEVILDMSAEQFLLCLRRFIAICGQPSLIVSDNAKQFRASVPVLDMVWQSIRTSDEVQGFSTERKIEWKFITEKAPWMGGFYERLIGIVKGCLKRVLGRSKVSLVELQTVVYEVSAVVNSRPLVPISDEIGCDVLTPAHFLGKTPIPTPEEYEPEADLENGSLRDALLSRWRRLKNIVHVFWKMWQGQYLISLRDRAAAIHQRNTAPHCPKEGSVVLVGNDGPRGIWKLARIEKLIVGGDGAIRSAVVRLSSGSRLTRAVAHLYPLETWEGNATQNTGTEPDVNATPDPIIRHSARRAAQEATLRIRQMAPDM